MKHLNNHIHIHHLFQSFYLSIQSFNIFFHFFQHNFLVSFFFILLKVFLFKTFSSKKSSLFKNLCYSSFSFPSPFAKKNLPRTNCLNSFCVSLLPFPKERRTNRLNSFVSPFSLVKEFKTTQSENSFDSSLSHKQKISKD